MKKTIASCIRKEMSKRGGTPREICGRLNADPKVKKLLNGTEVRVQTVATTLHQGDIMRNPRGWCKSAEGKPLSYTLMEKVDVSPQASASTPDVLEPLMIALLPAFASAMQVCLQVLAARANPAPGTANLADILAVAAKNFTYPIASGTSSIGGQKRA